jgi:hypothetical protein
VSTCYVSGRYDGVFTGGMIEEAGPFHNHYESSKHTAEVLVREAMADGLPATIYRPAIVVCDADVTVTAVKPENRPAVAVPVRSRSIAAGDTLSVVGRPDALRRLERAAESVPEGGDSESDPDGPGRRETQPSTARTEE